MRALIIIFFFFKKKVEGSTSHECQIIKKFLIILSKLLNKRTNFLRILLHSEGTNCELASTCRVRMYKGETNHLAGNEKKLTLLFTVVGVRSKRTAALIIATRESRLVILFN